MFFPYLKVSLDSRLISHFDATSLRDKKGVHFSRSPKLLMFTGDRKLTDIRFCVFAKEVIDATERIGYSTPSGDALATGPSAL